MLDVTLPGRVYLFAERRPDGVALREKTMGIWSGITWREYADNTAATARYLAELGVEAGDHVSILSDNRPEWLYADLGTQSIGARAVGIYQTNPDNEVAYILNDSGSKVLFVEDQEQADKAIAIADDTPTVQHVVVFDPRGTRHYTDPRLLDWDTFLERGRNLLADDSNWWRDRLRERRPEEPSMVVYTSGTTGPPKGALISSRNVLEISREVAPFLGVNEDDLILSYLPLCHVAEKIFTVFLPLTVGCTVHFGESIETVREDIKEVSPTVFLGVPRIWEKMYASVQLKMKDSSWLKRRAFECFGRKGAEIEARRRRGESGVVDALVWAIGDLVLYRPLQERLGMRRCRLPVTGAAPISDELLTWFNGVGIRILEGYGQTECAGVSHINPPHANRIGSVGTSLPLLECTTGEDGEILIRGPAVFEGYLNRPDATADTVVDGWLHTGDIGEIDDDGYLSITGRKKEIIITAGGKNLSPEYIENALKVSPYIKEAIAIGDRRKFVSALIQIDFDAVSDWATRRKLMHTSFEDLSGKAEVVELIAAEIETANEKLARVENVREFRLLPKELHQDDGEVTATQKVRRSTVEEKFSELIEEMYR
jgi:long-chain acyl-CoA synthetase